MSHTEETSAYPERHLAPPAETPRGRRPMSGSNWVGLILLLAAIAFYLFFALPEFFGIMGQMP